VNLQTKREHIIQVMRNLEQEYNKCLGALALVDQLISEIAEDGKTNSFEEEKTKS
jgi:hypothetical protein